MGLINAMFPYIIAASTFGFIGVILFGNLSKHTLMLLYAGLHGVALAMIFAGLFMAILIHAKPQP